MGERGRPRAFDRQEALRSAMRVFWSKGYEGATMAELTAAMGIGSPSLYAAFGSKEALFHEAVELYLDSEGSAIWEALPAAPTARSAVESFLERSVEAYCRDDRPRGCLVVLGALNATPASQVACAELRRLRAADVELLRARMERGVRDGDLPRGFDCERAARFYLAVQHGLSIQARDGATREQLSAAANAALAAWDGLVAQAPAASA